MKELKEYKYLIESATVKLWHIDDEEGKLPFLYQPHDPATGVNFLSDEEAENWIIEHITTRL